MEAPSTSFFRLGYDQDTEATRLTPAPAAPTPCPRPSAKTAVPVPSPYLKQLIDSCLVSPDAWQALPREQQDGLCHLATDPLLDALIARGMLTVYQADRIKLRWAS